MVDVDTTHFRRFIGQDESYSGAKPAIEIADSLVEGQPVFGLVNSGIDEPSVFR